MLSKDCFYTLRMFLAESASDELRSPAHPKPPRSQVVEKLLPVLLPETAVSGTPPQRLLREIVAVSVLQPALGSLAAPYTLNMIFWNLLRPYPPNSAPPVPLSDSGTFTLCGVWLLHGCLSA